MILILRQPSWSLFVKTGVTEAQTRGQKRIDLLVSGVIVKKIHFRTVPTAIILIISFIKKTKAIELEQSTTFSVADCRQIQSVSKIMLFHSTFLSSYCTVISFPSLIKPSWRWITSVAFETKVCSSSSLREEHSNILKLYIKTEEVTGSLYLLLEMVLPKNNV